MGRWVDAAMLLEGRPVNTKLFENILKAKVPPQKPLGIGYYMEGRAKEFFKTEQRQQDSEILLRVLAIAYIELNLPKDFVIALLSQPDEGILCQLISYTLVESSLKRSKSLKCLEEKKIRKQKSPETGRDRMDILFDVYEKMSETGLSTDAAREALGIPDRSFNNAKNSHSKVWTTIKTTIAGKRKLED